MIEEMSLRFIAGEDEPGAALPTAHDTVKIFDARGTAWYVHIRRVIEQTTQIDGTVVLKVLASRERCGDDSGAKQS